MRRFPWAGLAVAAGSMAVVAVACSSDSARRAVHAGAAGAAGDGGAAGSGGGSGGGGGGGDDGGEPGLISRAGAAEGGGAGEAGGDRGGAGGAEAGSAGGPVAGAGGDGNDEPTVVATFGCFIRSGDGGDVMESGEVALNVVNPVYGVACDSQWIAADANAYTPEQTPTTVVFRRSFVIDPALGEGDFSITYQADDAVDFVLNGQLILGCTPPDDNVALCQQGCRTSAIPAGALNPPGSVNTLEAHLINTISAATQDGNFGYSALNYSVCVTEHTE